MGRDLNNTATRKLRSPDSLHLPERLSRYKLGQLLDKGGSARVYKAEDTTLGRIVALKILHFEKSEDAQWVIRFLKEAQTAASLAHPNIATVFEIGEDAGIRFIAMEYCEGPTLARKVTEGSLTFVDIVNIAVQVAGALEAAHLKGIIHRDIKPANIIFTASGTIKVLDFGLAKRTAPVTPESTQDVSSDSTKSGTIVGSVHYMSPEQILGKDLNPASDIFSLGVTLYQIITRRLPFSGTSFGEITNHILHSHPEAMSRLRPEVPAELERMVSKCLEKQRQWRYQSATELIRDLRDLSITLNRTDVTHSTVRSSHNDSHFIQPAASSPHEIDQHVVNDDLLINEEDFGYAKAQFSSIIHVLDHPELREKFIQYDNKARDARRQLRRLGLVSVTLFTSLLLTLATQPLLPPEIWVQRAALIFQLLAIISGSITLGSVCLGPWKRRWLESRLMAEKLRQWHFQLIARRGHDIEKSCTGTSALKSFQKQRSLWFSDFLKTYEGKLDAQLETTVNEPGGIEADWLHDGALPVSSESPVLPEVKRAYERLRLDQQYDYAVWKLRKNTDKPLWCFLDWPAISQMRILDRMTLAVLFGAALCCVFLVYGRIAGRSANFDLYFRTAAVSLALTGAATRLVRRNLAAEEEIQRCFDYREKSFQLRNRFRQETDAREITRIMEMMEMAAVDEMKAFLRVSYNSTIPLM